MPRKPTQSQQRLEAIMQHKGKKSLKEIWDEDQELDPKTANHYAQVQSDKGNKS
jgi:hypothetical protein